MGNKNKLLSILTVLIANPAYAAMDCNTQPSCVTLGYSKNNVADCASDGYIYCPFDTSYKKCVTKTIKCPGTLTNCSHNIKCTNDKCQVVYYNCEDAGYLSTPKTGVTCTDTVTVTLRSGAVATCYGNCEANSSTSCIQAGYSDSGCDMSLESAIPVYLPQSTGVEFTCWMCVPLSDYQKISDASHLISSDKITIANLDEKQCRTKYVEILDNATNEADCAVYI